MIRSVWFVATVGLLASACGVGLLDGGAEQGQEYGRFDHAAGACARPSGTAPAHMGSVPRFFRVVTAPTRCPLPTDCPTNGEKVSAYSRQVIAMQPDVLVATEAFWGDGFETRIRADLEAALGGTWMARRGPHPGATSASGGVVVFSRFPIKRVSEHRFEDAHYPDTLTNKGLYVVTLDLGALDDGTPVEVHVMGIHMQAISISHWPDPHREQVEALGKFMRFYRNESRDAAALKIFTGDLNMADTIPGWLSDWRTSLRINFSRFRDRWVLRPTGFVSAGHTCGADRSARSCALERWGTYPAVAPQPFEHPTLEQSVLKHYYVGRGRYHHAPNRGYREVYMAPRQLCGRDYATNSLQTERAIAFDHAPIIVDYELAAGTEVMGSHFELNGAIEPDPTVFYTAAGGDAFSIDPKRPAQADPYGYCSEFAFPFHATHGPRCIAGSRHSSGSGGLDDALDRRGAEFCGPRDQLPPRYHWGKGPRPGQGGGKAEASVEIRGHTVTVRSAPWSLDRGLNRARCIPRRGGHVAVLANPLVEASAPAAAAGGGAQLPQQDPLAHKLYAVVGDPQASLGVDGSTPPGAGPILVPPDPRRYRYISEYGIEQTGIRFVSRDALPNPRPEIGHDCPAHARYACGRYAGLQVKWSNKSIQGGVQICTYECQERALGVPHDLDPPSSNSRDPSGPATR